MLTSVDSMSLAFAASSQDVRWPARLFTKCEPRVATGRVSFGEDLVMNFFGHAAVATDFERDPAYILGSMLPDFCSMLAARPPVLDDERLVAGVRLHHATDLVFHDLEAFQRLSRRRTGACSRAVSGAAARAQSRTSASNS